MINLTTVGMNLGEYTYNELKVLSTAIIREQVYGEHPKDGETYSILKQWECKIIEAMVQVKLRENVQLN